jgi:hypothetical protein
MIMIDPPSDENESDGEIEQNGKEKIDWVSNNIASSFSKNI